MSSNLTLSANFKGDKIKSWSVYILHCNDGTYYTGITNDLGKRLYSHNLGKGAKYTSGRTPVKLVYNKTGFTESQARKEEIALKNLSRAQKIVLIQEEKLN